ncbi:MAG: hypothetical protein LBT74_01710 [Acidobacteriota bacterium]|jgi:hypothetical protein|nr:hypothetical protein [Acidobacteriota bacterium]
MAEDNPKIFTKTPFIFAAGAAAGVIFHMFARSDKMRSLTVNALAKGMQIKDDAQASLASIREDAEDIYAEARQQAQAGAKPAPPATRNRRTAVSGKTATAGARE